MVTGSLYDCFVSRFNTNDSSWHGLATVMYTPVTDGNIGSTFDVSDILHDPKNTLALLQSPSPPVASFIKFINGAYTIDEDELDEGFEVWQESVQFRLRVAYE